MLNIEKPSVFAHPISAVVFMQDHHSEPFQQLVAAPPRHPAQIVTWDQKLTLYYKFQSQQVLWFTFQVQAPDGSAVTVASSLIEVKNAVNINSQFPVTTPELEVVGTLTITCEEDVESKKKVYLVLKGKNLEDLDTFSKSDPYFYLFKKHEGGWAKIHESKVVKDNLNPEWEPVVMDYLHFCYADERTEMKIQCFDFDTQSESDYIGECTFRSGDLRPGVSFILTNPQKNQNRPTGQILVHQFDKIEESSFIDYLRQGMSMNLTVAIDYTSSNGLPSERTSLHFCGGEEPNEYCQAIEAVGKILSQYDSDQKFALLGFGGEPAWLSGVSHCFALNQFQDNPYVRGYEQVLRTYQETLTEIVLSGPSYFSELIRYQISLCEKTGPSVYHILLILTDGDVHDYQETVDMIVRASSYPMSILIIGVGHECFTQLKLLDADKKELVDSRGTKAERDIVQFVPFRQFAGKLKALAREALMEIPTQLMEYKKKHH
jgi:hypothetical protein